MPSDPRIQSLQALASTLQAHDVLYYQKAQPTLSDFEYDQLKAQYEALKKTLNSTEASQADLFTASSPIGDDRTRGFKQQAHRQPMLSLDNTYNKEELLAFNDRLERLLNQNSLTFQIEPKIDGLAVSLTYKAGKWTLGLTRGNGTKGDDVTANLKTIPSIPLTLQGTGPFPDVIELRGEVYMTFAEFERINTAQEEAGQEPYANPRNLAAGTLKLLDPRAVALRQLNFVCYGVGHCEPAHFFKKQAEIRPKLIEWGFEALPKTWTAIGIQASWEAIEILDSLRHSFPYGTDGAVIKLNDLALQTQAGSTAKAPRGLIAYKFAPEQADTILENITLQVGRTGVITPVAELTPVLLSGSTVARATLHNADEIIRKDIRIGDTVRVEKAGEVIPAIVKVLVEKRPTDSTPFLFPLHCPACHTTLIRLPEEVAWRCPNSACPPQTARRFFHFGSKTALDIENMGKAVVEQLLNEGLVHTLADLYHLTVDHLLALEGFALKASENLIQAISASKKAPLWRFVHGLGIPHVGAQTAKDLARNWPSFESLASATEEDLLKISGIGPKVAASVASFFQQPDNKALLKALQEAGVNPTTQENTSLVLANKTFVLTGTLPRWSREETQAKIEAAGGRVASSVSQKTHYVVAGEAAGSKIDKAKSLGIPLIDEAALRVLLGETSQ